jgi:hypothetical protein
MVAITVDLKTKGLALRPGASLQCRAFMKFRGPKALNDRWDEKAGLPRDAIRSQGSTRSWRKEKETGNEED